MVTLDRKKWICCNLYTRGKQGQSMTSTMVCCSNLLMSAQSPSLPVCFKSTGLWLECQDLSFFLSFLWLDCPNALSDSILSSYSFLFPPCTCRTVVGSTCCAFPIPTIPRVAAEEHTWKSLYREIEATTKAGAAVVTRLHVLEVLLYKQMAKSRRINFDF